MLVIIMLACLVLPAFADQIVVDPGGSGDALTIQGGVDLADYGDEVLVHPGIYHENIVMKSGVMLTSLGGAEVTTIDMMGGLGINCEDFVVGVEISGFKLTNGGSYCGGGVRLYNGCSAEIRDCLFVSNHTTYESAGIHVHDDSYANIHDNVFSGNTSLHSVCISVIVGSHAEIVDNVFKYNKSSHLSAGIGIHSSYAFVRGNIFYGNVSNNGSALRSWQGSFDAINNTFLYNESQTEAADVSAFGSNVTLHNNLFAFPVAGPAILTNLAVDAQCNVFWGYDTPTQAPHQIVGVNGNDVIDPLVCAYDPVTAALSAYSPCLTGPCGVIGANPDPGCTDQVPTEFVAWGDVKKLYD